MEDKKQKRIIANNKKAFHDYFVEETFEAGIELFGTEVKSVRQGSVNLKDSYCEVEKGEMFARGIHISPYEKGNVFNKDPLRLKRLLLHKKEILKIFGLMGKQGYTCIPISMYFKGSKVKLEIGLCKGKKLYDKREADAKRDADRMMDRVMRERNRY